MLRLEDRAGGPKVLGQPALGDGPTWVEELLDTAVRRVLGESFPPTPQERCERCAFQRCCPARSQGDQVVT
jgi:hypothetical protein